MINYFSKNRKSRNLLNLKIVGKVLHLFSECRKIAP